MLLYYAINGQTCVEGALKVQINTNENKYYHSHLVLLLTFSCHLLDVIIKFTLKIAFVLLSELKSASIREWAIVGQIRGYVGTTVQITKLQCCF